MSVCFNESGERELTPLENFLVEQSGRTICFRDDLEVYLKYFPLPEENEVTIKRLLMEVLSPQEYESLTAYYGIDAPEGQNFEDFIKIKGKDDIRSSLMYCLLLKSALDKLSNSRLGKLPYLAYSVDYLGAEIGLSQLELHYQMSAYDELIGDEYDE